MGDAKKCGHHAALAARGHARNTDEQALQKGARANPHAKLATEKPQLKNIIHFSHANGFPASTYRTIFAELADDYDLRFIERIGHDARFPVTQDWPHLVEQLLDDISRGDRQPV
jgi:hypothetical protein